MPECPTESPLNPPADVGPLKPDEPELEAKPPELEAKPPELEAKPPPASFWVLYLMKYTSGLDGAVGAGVGMEICGWSSGFLTKT